MSTFWTILGAVLGGSFAGALATVASAWIAARHDSRVRIHDLTAAEYTRALAAMEQVFHIVNSVYSELRRTLDSGAAVDDAALADMRARTDAAQTDASARQAPAKLLASPQVEQAISDFNAVLATKLIDSVIKGEGLETIGELNGIHNRLLGEMRAHLNRLQ